jgi:hypothetical protein
MNFDPIFLCLALVFITKSVAVLMRGKAKKNQNYIGRIRRSYSAWDRSRTMFK